MPIDTTGYPEDFGMLLSEFNQESDRLMRSLETGRITPDDWHSEMKRTMAKYSQSAMMLGKGGAIGGKELDSLGGWLDDQFKYLQNFATVIGSSSDYNSSWESRARMYGASTYTEYWEGKTEGLPLPAQPGQGTQCRSNCKCSWEIVWIDKAKGDADCYWRLGNAEHCQTCEVRAEMWNPVRIRGGNLSAETGPSISPVAPRQPRGPAPKPENAVSRAISWGKGTAFGKRVTETMNAIDGVHKDGILPKISIRQNRRMNALGNYQYFAGTYESVGINVHPVNPYAELTVAHEVGHFIDHKGLGRGGTFGSAGAAGGEMTAWGRAVQNSAAYQRLLDKRMNPGKYAVQLSTEHGALTSVPGI